MVLRLLTYWREIAQGERMPRLERLSPGNIPDMWPHCFLLDCGSGQRDPAFRQIGHEVARCCETTLIGRRLSEAPQGTLIRHATSYLAEMLSKRVPISRGGGFTRYDGARVLYRSIVLPVSSNGRELDSVLGAANCRVITEA